MFTLKKVGWRSIRRRWVHTLWRKDGKRLALVGLTLTLSLLIGLAALDKQSREADITKANYAQLLNTIAKGESKGNYNAYFGNVSNSSVMFTSMTVGEVLKWQQDYVAQGSPSNAVGKYQIIEPTLQGLVRQLNIDKSAIFNAELQDRLALALLERRGAEDYLEKKMTVQQFAANLAKEWAALPKVVGENPEESYYAGDGLNKAHITVDEIYHAIATLET